jgi:hypothetical protein
MVTSMQQAPATARDTRARTHVINELQHQLCLRFTALRSKRRHSVTQHAAHDLQRGLVWLLQHCGCVLYKLGVQGLCVTY